MRKPPRHCHCYENSHLTPHRHTGESRYPVPGLRGQQTTPGCWRGAIFIPLCGLRKAMVILNEAKRSEESKIADCKTTSSVGRNPRFLATLGMTRRRGVGLIIATILFTYPCLAPLRERVRACPVLDTGVRGRWTGASLSPSSSPSPIERRNCRNPSNDVRHDFGKALGHTGCRCSRGV